MSTADNEAPAPKIIIDHISGNCPVQAEGTVNGNSFYFRARGQSWSLAIGGPSPFAGGAWEHQEEYSEEPYAAGWMSEEEAKGFIEKAARIWAEQSESRPVAEVNAVTGRPKGESHVVAVVNVGPDWVVSAPEIPEEMVESAFREYLEYSGLMDQRQHVRMILAGAGVPALLARVEELEGALEWQPIATAPASGQFLVTDWRPDDDSFDSIELVQGPFLEDGRILNLNSGNYTNPGVWTWWRPLPPLPRAALAKKETA